MRSAGGEPRGEPADAGGPLRWHSTGGAGGLSLRSQRPPSRRRGSAEPRGVPHVKEIETRSPDVPGRGSPPRPARPASPLPAPDLLAILMPRPRVRRGEASARGRPEPSRSKGGDRCRPSGHPWLQERGHHLSGGPGPTFCAGPAPLLTPFSTSRVPCSRCAFPMNNGPRLGRGPHAREQASLGGPLPCRPVRIYLISMTAVPTAARDEGQTSSAGGAQRAPWRAAVAPAASSPGARLPDLDVGGRAGLSEPAETGKSPSRRLVSSPSQRKAMFEVVHSDLDTGGQGQAFPAAASHTGSRAGAFSKTLQSQALEPGSLTKGAVSPEHRLRILGPPARPGCPDQSQPSATMPTASAGTAGTGDIVSLPGARRGLLELLPDGQQVRWAEQQVVRPRGPQRVPEASSVAPPTPFSQTEGSEDGGPSPAEAHGSSAVASLYDTRRRAAEWPARHSLQIPHLLGPLTGPATRRSPQSEWTAARTDERGVHFPSRAYHELQGRLPPDPPIQTAYPSD
ncbi:collagen alpha-1(I) chain-like [Lontra canadensis]|uniref:collagen alpha-1(I) chain-like n=1 Tax=Lontra canadensis TaxID=76717 RepID=UPI0013F2BB63|nr:collagen alpha-1(I) chain-like [Lontra canadensis]